MRAPSRRYSRLLGRGHRPRCRVLSHQDGRVQLHCQRRLPRLRASRARPRACLLGQRSVRSSVASVQDKHPHADPEPNPNATPNTDSPVVGPDQQGRGSSTSWVSAQAKAASGRTRYRQGPHTTRLPNSLSTRVTSRPPTEVTRRRASSKSGASISRCIRFLPDFTS